MNKLQFWILTGLSGLVVVFLFLQIIIVRMASFDQARLVEAQRIIQQGQACDTRVRELAARIYQVSQQTQDQGLKDLLARQQITIAPPPANGDAGAEAAPAPAPAK